MGKRVCEKKCCAKRLLRVKASTRKSLCVKAALGKVSACKSSGV